METKFILIGKGDENILVLRGHDRLYRKSERINNKTPGTPFSFCVSHSDWDHQGIVSLAKGNLRTTFEFHFLTLAVQLGSSSVDFYCELSLKTIFFSLHFHCSYTSSDLPYFLPKTTPATSELNFLSLVSLLSNPFSTYLSQTDIVSSLSL